MFHWSLGWYCSYCAALLATRISKREQNNATEWTPHSVGKEQNLVHFCPSIARATAGQTREHKYVTEIFGIAPTILMFFESIMLAKKGFSAIMGRIFHLSGAVAPHCEKYHFLALIIG